MSWIGTHLQQFCINVLKCGPIPRHIAIIMDGNRRYATKSKVEKSEGHEKGYHKLDKTLKWCRKLGVTELTVYGFSIENFKRSPREVDQLLKLFTEKFQALLDDREKIMAGEVCIRIIGNMSLLPEELRKVAAEVFLMTKDNKGLILNLALAYTSRDEIVNTAKSVVEGVEKGAIEVDDIDEDLISSCLYTGDSPDPDIIIRTSGEVRFSDYLLWQISGSFICFTEVLWPEFCIWHLLACVFKYQRCYNDLKKGSAREIKNERAKAFVEGLQQEKLMQLKSYL